MKRILIAFLAVALVLSMATVVLANDNLRVEKRGDLENIVGTEADKIVEDVEELENEILEEVEEEVQNTTLISPNPSLIAPAESDVAIATKFEEGDKYVFEDNVELNSLVINGNLFVGGDNVLLESISVHGDVFLMGQNITVNGLTVGNSVYVLAGNAKMKFVSAKDIYSATQILDLSDSSEIERSMNSIAEKLTIADTIINKNLNFSGNEVSLLDGTKVSETFAYASTEEAKIAEGAEVKNVERTDIDKAEIVIEEEETPMQIFIENLKTFLAFFVAGIFMVYAITKIEGTEKYEKKALTIICELLIGLAGGIAILMIGICLMIITAGIGIPFVFTFWAIVGMAMIFAGAGAAVTFAKAFTSSTSGKKVFWLAFAIYTVYSVIKLIPVVQFIAIAIFFLVGTGHNIRAFLALLGRPFAKEAAKVAVEKKETPAVEPEVVENVVDEVIEEVKEEKEVEKEEE